MNRNCKAFKSKESDSEREEREAAVRRDHVEKERRSMSSWTDETEQQKRGNPTGKTMYRESGREMRMM